jgi:hypothetical protein
MPGTRQFILVNASPEKQHDFETISNRTAGRLVFHGTRPSALFSILSEGLQMMTNNNHIVNGAYYGNGIYLAEEPRTSVDFARANTSTWPNSSFAGDANTRVLLVCELAGNVVAPLQGIHVITDPRTVMVRYVFLLPANFQAPARANIEQAFLSAFAQLRRSS